MAAQNTSRSLIHVFIRGNAFLKNSSYRKQIFTSLKPVQCQRRAVSTGTGVRQRSLLPHLSPQLAGRSHKELYELSVKDPVTFWGSIANERLTWIKPFNQVKDCDFTSGKVNWFLGGQLNVSGKSLHVVVAEGDYLN